MNVVWFVCGVATPLGVLHPLPRVHLLQTATKWPVKVFSTSRLDQSNSKVALEVHGVLLAVCSAGALMCGDQKVGLPLRMQQTPVYLLSALEETYKAEKLLTFRNTKPRYNRSFSYLLQPIGVAQSFWNAISMQNVKRPGLFFLFLMSYVAVCCEVLRRYQVCSYFSTDWAEWLFYKPWHDCRRRVISTLQGHNTRWRPLPRSRIVNWWWQSQRVGPAAVQHWSLIPIICIFSVTITQCTTISDGRTQPFNGRHFGLDTLDVKQAAYNHSPCWMEIDTLNMFTVFHYPINRSNNGNGKEANSYFLGSKSCSPPNLGREIIANERD